MVDDQALLQFMRVIAAGETGAAVRALRSTPGLASAQLARGGTRASSQEYFLGECHLQLYAGDSALHVAAAAYDTVVARELVIAGADIRARNRRGGEPLHAATVGDPGSSSWDPPRQAAIVAYLIEAGADPDAVAVGGVTPLHRAVRNRCTAAVRALLEGGADRHRSNDNGSTAIMLAGWTTGRGGSGTPVAQAEQAEILQLLSTQADSGRRRP